jgi:hypothetical protein
MQGVTLLLGATTSFLILCVSPIYGLVIYIAALAWYPSDLAVSIGTIDFTLRRIVVLAVFAKIFFLTDLPGRFKLIWLDKLVVIYFVGEILAGAMTSQSLMSFLENRAGAVFDMALPYFTIRMILINKKQYLTLLKSVLIIAAPLAVIGFYQCLTGHNPAGFLKEYELWKIEPYVSRMRAGFFRADVVFSHSIMYGLFFAMLGPACAGGLRNINKNKTLYLVGLLLIGVGVFSSMSSGPWMALLFAVCFISLYFYRRYWKTVLITIILMCAIVEIISNRHFYDVLGGFALDPGTAWYRSRLIEVALYEGGMSGHWLTGYGQDIDTGWGPKIDGRDFVDMVNHYLLILQLYGLVGFVPFLAMNVAVVKKLVDAYKASTLDSDRWMVWCLSAGFFGLYCAFMSVSLFGQPTTIYYMMIALAGVMPTIVSKREITTAMVLS